MGYPSTAELIAASSDGNLTALTEPDQDALRASAINAIERWCGQRFTVEGTHDSPVTKVLDSPGGEVIYLPARLVELTEGIVTGSWITSSDIVADPDGKRVYIAPIDVASSTWLTRAVAEMEIGGGLPREFPAGNGIVSLTGVWGWTDAEWTAGALDAIARAIRWDMEERADADASQLAQTVNAARRFGLTALTEGGVSVTLGEGEPLLSSRVQREIEPFVWEGSVGAVA